MCQTSISINWFHTSTQEPEIFYIKQVYCNLICIYHVYWMVHTHDKISFLPKEIQ
jgi:hypothetical protein